MIEFRVDEFFDPAAAEADPSRQERDISRLVSRSPLPCILTCRSASEGGGYEGDENERASLYEQIATRGAADRLPPRYIDVEFAAFTMTSVMRKSIEHAIDFPDRKRSEAPGLILSAHDFEARPADLVRKLLAMRAEPAANVLKIAYRARSLRDNLELFEILSQADRPMIALGMGEFGLISRILAPKFGAFLTFASLRPESVTAPGQPTVQELLDLYRFRSIRPTTRVYGVVGWPVGHSLSPLVHNAAFARTGFDGVYLPLPIPAPEADNGRDRAEGSYASFKATLGALIDDPRLDFSGASVTLPHKENLVRFAMERLKSEPGVWSIDATSLRTGSANSLLIERVGVAGNTRLSRARIFNTDVRAAVEPLSAALGGLAGKRVAVAGAGGVARGIAWGLASAGAAVTVFNRDVARAAKLVSEISPQFQGSGSLRASPLEAFSMRESFHALVNCTPLGMAGGPDEAGSAFPLGEDANSGNLPPGPVVLDTVYNPVQTPLVREARRRGLRVIDGVTMFAGQAAAQSSAWTGAEIPIDFVEGLVRSKLEGGISEK